MAKWTRDEEKETTIHLLVATQHCIHKLIQEANTISAGQQIKARGTELIVPKAKDPHRDFITPSIQPSIASGNRVIEDKDSGRFPGVRNRNRRFRLRAVDVDR